MEQDYISDHDYANVFRDACRGIIIQIVKLRILGEFVEDSKIHVA